MKKKMMAIVLSGMLVLGAGMSVCAADTAGSEAGAFETAEEGGEPDTLRDGAMDGLAADETEGEGFHLGGDTLKTVTGYMGIDLSEDTLSRLLGLVKDPESARQTISGLVAEGGIGAKILDKVGAKDNTLGSVISSMKNGSGGYDLDKIIESLKGIKETDGSIEISGTKIPAEDLNGAVNDALGVLGLAQDAGTKLRNLIRDI